MCHLFLRMNIRSLSLKLIIIYLSASTKTDTPQMGSSNASDEKKTFTPPPLTVFPNFSSPSPDSLFIFLLLLGLPPLLVEMTLGLGCCH